MAQGGEVEWGYDVIVIHCPHRRFTMQVVLCSLLPLPPSPPTRSTPQCCRRHPHQLVFICMLIPDLLSTVIADIVRVEVCDVAARFIITESRWSSKTRGVARLQQCLSDRILHWELYAEHPELSWVT